MDQQEMQEKEMMKFSWTGFFLVTGCSSFIFSMALKILDGAPPRILLLIGTVTISLGLLNWMINYSLSLRKSKNEQPSL
ncbi:MAG: hypothetical protein ABIT05_06245 [Chitinophagaceae bacterium]